MLSRRQRPLEHILFQTAKHGASLALDDLFLVLLLFLDLFNLLEDLDGVLSPSSWSRLWVIFVFEVVELGQNLLDLFLVGAQTGFALFLETVGLRCHGLVGHVLLRKLK